MLWLIHFSLFSARCIFWHQIVLLENCAKYVQEYTLFRITCTPMGQYSCPAGTTETNHQACGETSHLDINHSMIESEFGNMTEQRTTSLTMICVLRN